MKSAALVKFLRRWACDYAAAGSRHASLLLDACADRIEQTEQELKMARDFITAAPIAVKLIADLTTANADLTKKLEAATANARTTGEAIAEQSIVDAVAVAVPEAAT